MSARESELQQEHRPAGGQQAEPDAAPTTHHSSSAAVAAAMRLQHGAGNRAAAARLSRAPAAGSTPMRTPAPAAKPAAKPAAGGAPAAGAKAAVPGELAKACEQLYTALNIGGLSSAKTEQILHTLDVNKAQGKALAAAYATTYGGRSLDADLRKLSDANYVRARDYVWFGGLRTMTKVLIAVAGAGTDTKTLMRLLEQVARERGSVGKPTDLWDALRKDANNPLGQRFRGEELEAMLNSQLDGTDVVRAKVLVTQGELKPIDKIFLALTQVGTDEDLLFEGLAAANPTTIRQEFKSYKFRPRGLWGGDTDLLAALDSELSGQDYDRALALLGLERNPDAGLLSNAPAMRARKGGKLVGLVKAAAHGAWVDKALLWKSIEDAPQAERDELAAKVRDPKDELGLTSMVTGLSAADLSRLRATLGIKEKQGAPGAESRRGAGTVNLDDKNVKALRALGGVDSSTVFDAIKMSSRGQLAEFRKGWLDTSSAFHAYVARNATATEEADLYTVVSTDLPKRIRWCFGAFTDDETYLSHLLGDATPAEQRTVAKTQSLMDLMRRNLSTSEFRRVQALLVPQDATPQEKAAAIDQQVRQETGGVMDLFLSQGDAVRDENRDLQVAAAAAKKPGASNDPKAQAALAEQAARADRALQDYKVARDEFVGAADMVVSTAIGFAATALTGGAAGPAVAAQLARIALAMAVSKVVTQKALKGESFDIMGSDGVRAAIDGAVEGVLMLHGALAARGIAVEMDAAQAATRQLTKSTYMKIIEPAAKEALNGGRDAAIGGIVSAATDDQTWNEGLLAAAQKMATSSATSFAQGAGMGVGGHGVAAVAKKVKARGKTPPAAAAAAPRAPAEPTAHATEPATHAEAATHAEQPAHTTELTAHAEPAARAESAGPLPARGELALRSPQEWLAMRESLGDLATRVPIVENPKLDGPTVRVHSGDADGVRMEIGPQATALHIARHVATARLLLQYEGALGKLRQLYEYVRSMLKNHPQYGTEGFEARGEVKKLNEILRELEGRKASIREHVEAIGAGGDVERELEALDAEMASLQEQLAHHQANVDSIAAGRGFIAAEGRKLSAAPPDWPVKSVTPVKKKKVGWTGVREHLKPGVVLEFPGGERAWLQVDGAIVVESRLGKGVKRLGDELELPSRGDYADPGYLEALYERAHSQGTGTGAKVPGLGVYLAPEVVNQRLQRWGVEELLYRIRDDFHLPKDWAIDIITVTKPREGSMLLQEIEYRIDVTRPNARSGLRERTQAINIEITVDTKGVRPNGKGNTIGRPKVTAHAEWAPIVRGDAELQELFIGVDMEGAESAIAKALAKGKVWDDVQFTTGGSGD